ncbi:MAG: acireductone synthase [Methylococcaceae bacterium]|jgi:enolase-phosphatase E1|nr:acireductone synthase [Methylococcaceae bacterium]MCF7987602.1 acireductone synthase [Methylovulum sp.]MCF7999240.1 acireductone synthase [Methylovulum sp.]
MIKAIVTDIEGTTSSLTFVKEVLFPYAYQHLAHFVRSHAQDPEIQALLRATAEQADISTDTEVVIVQLLNWIESDTKATPLKALQGLIWEAGYQQGDFTGHIYPDAVASLKAWHRQGLNLYIYSSGSIHAQQLLFGHTEYGNLNSLFAGYFDTQIGAKRELESYQRIAQKIDLPPQDIAFLSDIKEELDAAASVGFKTFWLKRTEPFAPHAAHSQVSDFTAIVM